MVFFIASLVFLFLGRKLGWALSKPLYVAPLPVVVVFCLLWGGIVAAAIHGLIIWQEPSWILRWIFGYALGGYVSIPNYGLVHEATVPDEAIRQHALLKSIPWVTYIVLSIALYFLLRQGYNPIS